MNLTILIRKGIKMSRKTLFPVFLITIFTISLLFLSTCKKDPTSPNDNAVQTTVTIGVDGGTLETDDFSLQVPAGSFTEEVTLNLSISSEPSSFGESSVSQPFILEGLPEDFEKSVRLALKYNGELSDSSYIAHGSISKDFLTGDSSEVYQFISGKDSSGFFIGYLSTRKGINTGKLFRGGKNIDLVGEIFQVVTKYGIIYTDPEHFAINYPKSLYSPGVVTEFGNLLEEIHTKLETDLGFRFHFKDTGWCDARNVPGACWIWPIPITIKNVEDKMLGGLNKSKKPLVWYGPYFNVDGILMGSLQNLDARAKIGKNFAALRLLSIKYDTYYYDERKWLGWATYGWLQDYFSNNTIVPYEFSGNELAPFNGLQFGSALETHGHGMVSIIKYLVDTEILALNRIGGIFNTIHEQNIHPVNALLNNVNGLVADWWPDYFEKLIKGEIYNIRDSVFLNDINSDDTWNINTEGDTSEVFLKNYSDLSAKRFIINLNHDDIDSSATLLLDATGNSGYDGIATLVFAKNSSNNLEHLFTAKNGPVEIPKLREEYYDKDKVQFLVVVVNSMHNGTDYKGNSDIELQMKVKQENYNRCSILYSILHDSYHVKTNNDGSQHIDERTAWWYPRDWYFEGILEDNIFNGDIIGPYPAEEIGTLTVELNPENDMVINFNLIALMSNVDNTHITDWKVEGSNIPISTDDGGHKKFRVEDYDVCNYITNSFRKNTILNAVTYLSSIDSTTNYSCDDRSYIEIDFWSE